MPHCLLVTHSSFSRPRESNAALEDMVALVDMQTRMSRVPLRKVYCDPGAEQMAGWLDQLLREHHQARVQQAPARVLDARISVSAQDWRYAVEDAFNVAVSLHRKCPSILFYCSLLKKNVLSSSHSIVILSGFACSWRMSWNPIRWASIAFSCWLRI
jgi:hypothetical protein